MLRLGSLFSGSGGFELAGSICGIEPIWASEIEPFPIRVTTKRFPNMRRLGDINTIKGDEIEPCDVVTFGSPCFPVGTLVLTKKGYESIENIRVGDEVFTHKGNWKPVSAIGYKYSRTVKMKGNHYGLIATPNHPFYSAEQGKVWNGNGYTRTLENIGEWTPAEEMQGKRWAVPNCISGLKIPNIERTSAKQNQTPEINEDLMYIIGRYLGDGWFINGQRTNRPKGQTRGQIFICANRGEADYLEERIHRVFDGISAVNRFSERTVEKFRVSNQALCEWILDNFGCKAEGKTIPSWVYCMSEGMREALLRGYLDSDGYHFKENTWKAATVSKKLAHGIRLLAETLGYSATVHFNNTETNTTIEGRTVNQKPWYQIVMSDEKRKTSIKEGNHTWYKCRYVEPYSDEQKVYNITVDDDHSYIVEGFVVHNCQDMSIAGKREGIKHSELGNEETTRSGLFMEAVRIIREMREATNGKYPTFAVWENVPGAFSSNNGEDFRAVLEELEKTASKEPIFTPKPPNGKWLTAGEIVGDNYSIAWRTLDAQYWGVPQRRKRIYLVADFRGQRAGKILFERKGMRWNFAQGGTAWQGTSGNAQNSINADDRKREAIGLDFYNKSITGEKAKTITAIATDADHISCVCYDVRFSSIVTKNSRGHCYETDTARTISTGNNSPDTNHGGVAVVYSIESHPMDSRVDIDESGNVQTLTNRMGTGGGNVPLVMEKLVGINGDIATTLDASYYKGCGMRQGVEREVVICIDRAAFNQGINGKYDIGIDVNGTAHTLIAKGPGAVAFGIGNGQVDQTKLNLETVGCLNCMYDQQAVLIESEPKYIVRRLTPVECCRLQGFPDYWCDGLETDEPGEEELQFWRDVFETHRKTITGSSKPKTDKQIIKWLKNPYSDSAIYKMWENGICLQNATFVLEGIVEELNKE